MKMNELVIGSGKSKKSKISGGYPFIVASSAMTFKVTLLNSKKKSIGVLFARSGSVSFPGHSEVDSVEITNTDMFEVSFYVTDLKHGGRN